MAIAESGKTLSLRKIFLGAQETEKPKLYSQKEIVQMILTTPPDLQERERINIPIGTWHLDGQIAIFDPKSKEEIDKITKISTRTKLSKLANKILQMS